MRWLVVILLLFAAPASAERISDIRNTKHNLSAAGPGTVKATSEDEVCVFCHTPHGGQTVAPRPLWNRALSGATYTPYTSSSMDVTGLGQPGGSSKLCLSCHDGTIAIGSVNVLDGAITDLNPNTAEIVVQGTAADGTMPPGEGEDTGFTRDLGTDLSNDHPISFDYTDALASLDGELRTPSANPHIATRAPGLRPLVPLEDGQLQCTSCHDPHIRDTVDDNIKFLRLHRFQRLPPGDGSFDETSDIICLACHDKDGWVGSAHANPQVADELYETAAASLREFPQGTQVWQAACLNCHDTHSVPGSRRLLREGTDSLSVPKHAGSAALEETCYQCHSSDGGVLVGQGGASFAVPDIKSDFQLLRHMPISEQPEVHDIGTGTGGQLGADLIESANLLGKGGQQNRHAECTDCHHPHRMTRNRRFNDDPTIPDAAGTHDHDPFPSNIASGVLRGSWGVEPVYGSTSFLAEPTLFIVKRGDLSIGVEL